MPLTKPADNKTAFFFNRHRKTIWFTIFFFVLWACAAYIFFRRFPNNYTEPNFYAEDGSVFARNLIEHGLLRTLTLTFNGYYTWGIYILEKIGFILNALFFGNEFANLPRSFALTSYLFLGLVASLPVLLFRKYLRPQILVFITLLSLFVPMTGYDYAIIGTIGNLKFAFINVAFLLLVYRHLMPENSKKVYLIDLALLVCAYTNITVYPMMLFALLRYVPKLKGRDFYKRLLRDRSFQSLFGLGVLMVPQLLIVAIKGVPELKGYLDTGFDYRRTIEIFVGRSYLHGIIFPVNKLMNDAAVIILALLIIVAGLRYSGKYRPVFLFGIMSIFLGTFLFVIKRTGVSEFYTGYDSSGPDQFFYAQNWIFGFIASILAVQLIYRIRFRELRVLIYIVVALGILVCLAPNAGSYGKTNFMSESIGTIYAEGKESCETQDKIMSVDIYPSTGLEYTGLTRQQLCTPSVTTYTPESVSFGLAPYDNTYLDELGGKNTFTQTFTSPEANLNGITIYFSTFLRTPKTPYNLTLFDSTCGKKILTTPIQTSQIDDNSFFMVSLPVQRDSKNKTYCFDIRRSGPQPDPLAIQLSKPDIYTEGQTTINGEPDTRDVVFKLHYE